MNTRSTTRNLEDPALEAGETSQRMDSVVEEPTVQDNPSGSSGTVGDSEEEALRRRLDVLRAENAALERAAAANAAKMRLEDEILREETRRSVLQREIQGDLMEETSQATTELVEPVEPASRLYIASQTVAPRPYEYYKQQHVEKPVPYKGKSLREYSDFVAACKNEYMLFPRHFTQYEEKIRYAIPYLDRKPRIAWQREDATKYKTWDDFDEFLLNQIADKVNRQIRAVNELERAKMREGQPISEFADYLNLLQTQIRGRTEEVQYNTLLAKIPTDIQLTLLARADESLPTTQTGLISAVERIQGRGIIKGGSSQASQPPPRGAEPRSSRKRERSSSPGEDRANDRTRRRRPWRQRENQDSRTPATGSNTADRKPADSGSTVTCRRCGQTGHGASRCPTIECFTCGKKGHIAPNCPEAGKGRAQG